MYVLVEMFFVFHALSEIVSVCRALQSPEKQNFPSVHLLSWVISETTYGYMLT